MSHKGTKSDTHNVTYRQISSKWKDIPFRNRTRYSETLHKTESMVSLCFQSLISFVNSDNLPGLQSFLETKQLQIDDRDENGTTALMVASTKGKGAFVRELLAHGADPNAEDNDSWTALLCASKEGHYDIVLQLLEHNAEIDHRDMGGWTALMWATYKGHTSIAIHLLERDAEVNAHGNYHISSLLWAAGRGHLEIVKALIDHRAKVNVGDKYGTTAIIWASRKGYTEIVELLIRAGANVDTAGMYSWTPLIVATYGNHVDVVNLLLEHKPNVNALDKDGCSPLTIACKEGCYEIATSLLAAGAYVNIQDRVGDTNLIHAVKGGHKNVVEALLKKYADVDILGKDKKSACYVAVEKGNINILKLLLNHNPDLENATKDNDTPLLKAVRNRNADIVQLLLEKKAKVSAADKKGDTALHIAMRARSKAIVEILLRNPKHSQLLYRPNRAGETPYNIDLSHPKTILGQIFGARRLNTNEDNENMLGYDLYSSALADILSEPSLSMPITVGLYAKWGSGKSFLLTKLKEEMKNFAKEWVDPVFQFTSLLFLIIVHLSLIVATVVYIITEATTVDMQPEIWSFGIAIGFFIMCFLFLAFIWFANKSYDWDWPYNFNVNLTRKMNNIKLVLEILFCHPPGTSNQDGVSAQPIRFYFTDKTRVSSTTGGENSVVQMIGSLYDSIENHYGTLATRLYRAFKPKPVKSSSTWTWRKMCCLPYVVIFEITFCMIIIGLSALTFYLKRVNSDENVTISVAKPSLEIILIVAALLLAVATIANAYTWSKLLMSVLFSQRRHLQRSISKLDTLKSEGFLQTLRQEVNLMKDMVKCLDGLSAQQTRLVIVVDGLDSCEQEKVLLILDTVHLLFSDANSPFIVILAIDPHVIAKAVEMNARRLFTESNIGGHSYLNNMVHLPFYLQNSGLRKVKVAQQTAAAHRKTQASGSGWAENEENLNTFLARSSSSRRLSNENTLVSASRENLKYAGARKGSRKLKLSDSVASSIGSNLNRIGGAQDLTKMLLTDDYFSDVNPRSMRRLMNVVYVTGRLLKAFQIDFNWYRLASWINITEQWPFRTSWIIYHYDLYEDQLEDNTPLKSIYDKIRPLIPSIKDSEPLLELDRDEKKFDIFLTFHRSSLLVSDLKIFLPFTINLDPYLKKVIKEETQSIEEDGLFMSAIRPSPYSSLIQPPIQAWNSHVTDWSGTPTRHFMTPPNMRERRQGVVSISKVGPPPGMSYPQAGPVASPWTQCDHLGSVTSASRPPTGLPPVTLLEPEILKMRLSAQNVDGVCKLLSTMEDLSQNAVPEYVRLIKENNINGRVLLHCDLDDLKKLLNMSFGDWEMFKVTLIQLREYEITSILRQDEGPPLTVRKPERKGSIKASSSGVDKTDNKMQTEIPRERKQSVIEKQVTLEEQMICGALQTLNEEACEDVLEETEETKITIDQDLPQTSVIPPSPDCPQDIQAVLSRGYRSRTNSASGIGETDFVLLQSSPIGHMHWQPVSISIAGYSESLSDHSSRCSSQPPSPVQERRYSNGNKSGIKFTQEISSRENRGRHVIIKTDSDAHRVSISSNNSTVVYENHSNKPLEHQYSGSQSQSKSRPSSLTLLQKESKPHRLALRNRSKSIDNSNNFRKDRSKERIVSRDKLQRFREKLLQSSPDLNETSDNESTPLVSEVSSPSNKSGQSSEPKTSASDSFPVSPTSQNSLTPDRDLRKHTRSEQNLTETPDYSPFHPPLSDCDAYGGDKTSNHGPTYVESSERCRVRSRTLSGDSDSSLTGFLSDIRTHEDVTNSNCSLLSLSPSSGHLSRQNAMDSEENLTDVYCNPARSN